MPKVKSRKIRAKKSKIKNRKLKISSQLYVKNLRKRILKYNEEQVCEDVKETDDLTFLKDMKKILSSCKEGVGMAAPQIGIYKNAIIIDPNKSGLVKIMINPVIIEDQSQDTIETVEESEGCLSYPGFYTVVKRNKKVKVKYLTKDFKEATSTFSDFEARIVQHEIDHLLGECIIAKEWKKKKKKKDEFLAKIGK